MSDLTTLCREALTTRSPEAIEAIYAWMAEDRRADEACARLYGFAAAYHGPDFDRGCPSGCTYAEPCICIPCEFCGDLIGCDDNHKDGACEECYSRG